MDVTLWNYYSETQCTLMPSVVSFPPLFLLLFLRSVRERSYLIKFATRANFLKHMVFLLHFFPLRKQISRGSWKSRVVTFVDTIFEHKSHFPETCLIEIRHHYSVTSFSRYNFAKSWRRAGERCFAFVVVAPACFVDHPDRSWILAYHVVLSGPLIITSLLYITVSKYTRYTCPSTNK